MVKKWNSSKKKCSHHDRRFWLNDDVIGISKLRCSKSNFWSMHRRKNVQNFDQLYNVWRRRAHRGEWESGWRDELFTSTNITRHFHSSSVAAVVVHFSATAITKKIESDRTAHFLINFVFLSLCLSLPPWNVNIWIQLFCCRPKRFSIVISDDLSLNVCRLSHTHSQQMPINYEWENQWHDLQMQK